MQDLRMAAFAFNVLLMCTLLTTVRGQPSIVSRNSIRYGDFQVYCDASRAIKPQESVRGVQSLSIYRRVETNGNFSLIAKYNSVNTPNLNPDVKNIPDGKNWTITFSGGNNGSDNIDTMKIVMDVEKPSCDDAGTYRCQIEYFLTSGGSTSVQAPDQNVEFSDQMSNFELQVDPLLSIYKAGDSVMFTCSIISTATDVTLAWKVFEHIHLNEQPENLPRNTEINNPDPVYFDGINGCTRRKYISTLKTQVPLDYWRNNYQCVAASGSLSKSIFWTLGTTQAQEPAKIVSTNKINPGWQTTVYCDANRASHPLANVQSVQSLSVYRMVAPSKSYSLIAKYDSMLSADHMTSVKNIPERRQWNITFSGDNGGSDNIDTMNIVFYIYDTSCADAGTYRCQIEYALTNGSTALVQAPDQNITYLGVCHEIPSSSVSCGPEIMLTLSSFIIYQIMMKLWTNLQ